VVITGQVCKRSTEENLCILLQHDFANLVTKSTASKQFISSITKFDHYYICFPADHGLAGWPTGLPRPPVSEQNYWGRLSQCRPLAEVTTFNHKVKIRDTIRKQTVSKASCNVSTVAAWTPVNTLTACCCSNTTCLPIYMMTCYVTQTEEHSPSSNFYVRAWQQAKWCYGFHSVFWNHRFGAKKGVWRVKNVQCSSSKILSEQLEEKINSITGWCRSCNEKQKTAVIESASSLAITSICA